MSDNLDNLLDESPSKPDADEKPQPNLFDTMMAALKSSEADAPTVERLEKWHAMYMVPPIQVNSFGMPTVTTQQALSFTVCCDMFWKLLTAPERRAIDSMVARVRDKIIQTNSRGAMGPHIVKAANNVLGKEVSW